MIFESKDEKISKMEKKVKDLENKITYNFDRVNETITTLNEIILHLQSENTKLKNEKDFLVERHKKMLRRVPVPDLSREINDRLVKPVKENADLITRVAADGLVELKEPEHRRAYRKNPAKDLKEHIMDEKPSRGKTIDKLFEIVSEAGKIRADEAARRLNVHEVQVEEWGKILEDHDLIKMKKTHLGKVELVKI